MPEDEIQYTNGPAKKQRGKFELWYKYKKSMWREEPRWIRRRSYKTKELAEQNLGKKSREWSFAEWEIRIKE